MKLTGMKNTGIWMWRKFGISQVKGTKLSVIWTPTRWVEKTYQEGPSPSWMNNHLEGDIKSKQGAYKGWKKESTSKESYVLDVRKYTGKVRTARNQTKLNLEKKIKASSNNFFSYRNEREQENKD